MNNARENMRRLGGTDLWVSGLGFGCAPIMGRVGKSKSVKALATAFDAGINFFDIARSYGYGEAEGVLGSFLRGRRDQAVIATKVGIRAAPQSLLKKTVRALCRPLIPLSSGLHRIIRSQVGHQFQPGMFTPAEMKQSLETSLRELRTDRVDILYLHDVRMEDLKQGSIMETCAQFITEGKVRYLGLATGKDQTSEILQQHPGFFNTVSITCNLMDTFIPISCQSGIGLVGREPFGGHEGLFRLHEQLRADTDKLAQKHNELTMIRLDELASLSLSWALHHSKVTTVIASFFDAAHVAQNLHVLRHPEYRAELCSMLGHR